MRGNLNLRQAYFVWDCLNSATVYISNRVPNTDAATSKGLKNDAKGAPVKRLKLSLSKEKPRFGTPLLPFEISAIISTPVPEEMMTEISKGIRCINTEQLAS